MEALPRKPIRHTRSEVLLKRTTATAAAKAYPAFIEKYPTLVHLAGASEEELAKDLMPVGLYRQRAKAVYKMARYIMETENGKIPNSLECLLKIPGLGEYSARAILSFGLDVPIAVVDANVERVIERVFQKAIADKSSQSLVQTIADGLLPKNAHQEFNFGMLDFGALVCRYARPRHEECPLVSLCDFYKLGVRMKTKVKSISMLREVRLSKRVGLVQLAEKARMSKLTIINIEAGRTVPREDTLKRLAIALGVGKEELISKQ